MIKIYVLSHRPKSLSKFTEIIANNDGLSLQGYSSEFLDLLIHIDEGNSPDLLIVDFKLSQQEILSVHKLFKSSCKVAFLLGSSPFDKKFFDRNNISYIGDPSSIEDLQPELIKIDTHSKKNKSGIVNRDNYIFVRGEKGRIIKINLEEILYVESDGNYVIIFLGQEKHVINFTLSAFQNTLPETFLRVHRSFIINCDKIKVIESNKITLDQLVSIPIGQSFRKQVLDSILSKIIELGSVAIFIKVFNFYQGEFSYFLP